MEIVTPLPVDISGARNNTQKYVEEWFQRDRFTGMFETARVESDLWANNTSNSRHHFGKVVNSRAKNLVDGSVQQHKKTKQLEVYQAHTPGGSVQVIRSHTSTTSSWHNLKMSRSYESRSEWPSDYTDNCYQNNVEFSPSDNLQLQHNFVNLDLERTKANIGRSRPPRRPFKRSKPQALKDEFFCNLPNTDELSNETEDCLNVIARKCKITSPVKLSIPTMLMNNDVDPQLEKTNDILNQNLASKIVRKGQSSPFIFNSEARWSFQNLGSKQYGISANNKSVLERALERAMKLNCDTTEKSPIKATKPVADARKMMNLQPSICKRTLFVTEETLKATKQKLRHLDHAIATVPLHNNGDSEDNSETCAGRRNNSEKGNDKVFMDDQAIINDGSGTDYSNNESKKQEVATAEEWFDCNKFHPFGPTHTICKPSPALTNNIGFEITSSTTDTNVQQPFNSELAPKSAFVMKNLTQENKENTFGFNEETLEKYAGPPVGVLELMTRFQKKLDTQLNHEISRKPKTTSDSIVCSGKVAGLIQNFHEKTYPTNVFQVEITKEEDCKMLTEIQAGIPVPNAERGLTTEQNSSARNNVEYLSKLNPHENLCVFTQPNDNSIGDKNRDVPSLGTFTNEEDAIIDGKKPKKVEFSKTEVHFAVAEPGKIKIVETNEKPPPLNLHRRKKRVPSTSPKTDSSMPITGIYIQRDVPIKSDRRENQSNITTGVEGGKNSNCSYFESSLASDNGLEVRILSTKSIMNTSRSQSNENKNKKSGYSSTRVNFVDKDVFVVADTKSYPAVVSNEFANRANGITLKKQNATSFSSSSHVGEIPKESELEPPPNYAEISTRKASLTNDDVKQPKVTSVADDLRLQTATSKPMKNEEEEEEEEKEEDRSRKKNCPAAEKSSNDVIKNKKAPSIEGSEATIKKNRIICKENSFGGGDVITSARVVSKFGLESERRQYKPVEVGTLPHVEKNILIPAERRPLKKNLSELSKSRPGKLHFESSTVTDAMSSARNNIIHNSRKNVQTKGRDSWLNLPRDCEEGTGRSLRSSGSRHKSAKQKSARALTGVQKETTTPDSRTSKLDKSCTGFTSMSRTGNRENKMIQMSKPPMALAASEKNTSKVKDNNMERELPREVSHSSHQQPRSLRTRKVEQNINFLELQTPSLLKTKERIQRLAQTSESEDTSRKINTSRSMSKMKNHNGKAARIPPNDQFKQLTLLDKLDADTRRLIQQKTAKMQMNIFNLKEKPSPSQRTASDQQQQQSFKTTSNSTYPYCNLRPAESSKQK